MSKVDEQGCEEEEEAERKRKLAIRRAKGTGDERIRRGNTKRRKRGKGTGGGRVGGKFPLKDSQRKRTSLPFYPRKQRYLLY